ncbi:MAG: Na(+)/H(+) antiporter subunit D [Deltaproteobacteria bacterium]|nr:Na(+)/H(+) antiporter subunit D [Deltaproteobacteria bacterium]
MDNFIHPALFFILGAFLIPVFKGWLKKVYLLAIPAVAFLTVLNMNSGVYGEINYLGFNILLGRVDRLSLVFAHVFTLMAFIGVIYGLHVKEDAQHIASFFYVGGSLGVVFAGDYLTVFIFWEMMALASTFLIWFRREPASLKAGFRYLLMHIFGGLLLLAGIFLHYKNTGSMSFVLIPESGAGFAEYLILAGFALNAAVFPLHAWLPDAYPEATVTGAVFMCAFTTKTAVYVLARGFPGFEVLAIMGTAMTIYGVCYATIENDMRRILSYHIISQVGYMVAGVGIGTELALNGACAHAYAHILYKALLFMGAGSVLMMTGTSKLNQLGGLYKYMPLSLIFYVVGGISISGFPLFSGFVSKSMIVAGAGEAHHPVLMVLMLLASVWTFLSVGLKLPYFAWFGRDCGLKPKEPPKNMLWAIGLTSFLCLLIGVYPKVLYDLLPFQEAAAEYHPYALPHLSETVQILLFTGLGFFLLLKRLQPEAKINLDFDWFYRKLVDGFMWFDRRFIEAFDFGWGELYRSLALKAMMAFAGFFAWFDRWGIDGVVDNVAYGTQEFGNQIRKVQTGNIQNYLAGALLIIFVIIGVYWFL